MRWWVLLLLAACQRGERPLLQKTEIDVFEGRDVVGWDAPRLLSRLDAALVRVGFVMGEAASARNARPWRVAIAARIDEPDPQAEEPGSAVVVLSFRQKGAPETFEIEASERTATEANDVEAVQAAAVKALDLSLAQAAAEARATIDLDKLTDEALAPKAADSDAAVQAAAVRLLARRRHPAALPALVKRLESDDLGVLRRTMGLLVELKNQQAVPAIIDASRAKNIVFQREVVFAIAAIGGTDAEAYLDAVASGHDDPLVRASAEKALGELRSRALPTKPEGTTP